MGKRIIFPLRRLGHLTRDEFQTYWRTTHGPLVARHAATLGIIRYQQVHTLHEARPTKVPCFDGVAELWVDPSRRSTDANALATASQALLDDEKNFIDHSNSPIWIADEDPVLDGPKTGLRGTAVLRRRDGISREDFKRHWHDIHAPWALGRPDVWGFVRYIQNHTPANADDNPLARERNAPPAFDGLSEIYRVASTAPADEVARLRDELLADEPNFMDVDASPVFMGEVHVIIGEP